MTMFSQKLEKKLSLEINEYEEKKQIDVRSFFSSPDLEIAVNEASEKFLLSFSCRCHSRRLQIFRIITTIRAINL